MKTRLGFVSNSSSSSFCVYGVDFGSGMIMTQEDVDYMSENKLHDETGEHDSVYIGREWQSIGDDETGRQFKDSIAGAIEKRWPGKTCGTHKEGWLDR